MLPILMVFFYGSVELTRYVWIAQKVEKLAYTMADVASQDEVLTQGELDILYAAANDIMRPFTIGSNGAVMLSSLYRPEGTVNAKVNWSKNVGGTLTATSRFGVKDSIPSMPVIFSFDSKENIIAAEVFYRFSPILTSQFFGTTTLYRAAFYRPRLGALVNEPT